MLLNCGLGYLSANGGKSMQKSTPINADNNKSWSLSGPNNFLTPARKIINPIALYKIIMSHKFWIPKNDINALSKMKGNKEKFIPSLNMINSSRKSRSRYELSVTMDRLKKILLSKKGSIEERVRT